MEPTGQPDGCQGRRHLDLGSFKQCHTLRAALSLPLQRIRAQEEVLSQSTRQVAKGVKYTSPPRGGFVLIRFVLLY